MPLILSRPISNYLDLYTGQEFFPDIRDYAEKNSIPVISLPTAYFLHFIITLQKPLMVLEIGTAVGYSALVIAQAMASGCITTIELSEPCYGRNQFYFQKYQFLLKKKGVRITALQGKAQQIIPGLKSRFDLVFIDGRKDEYLDYLQMVLPRLKKQALIIADNCLWQGRVLSGYKQSSPGGKIIDQFNKTLFKDQRFIVNLVPVGDGLLLALKK